MLWLWNWMVFVSAGICVPIDVVLCYNSLLWQLLPQGSKRAGWSCCFCNCCIGLFSCGLDYNSGSPLLGAPEDILHHIHISTGKALVNKKEGYCYSPRSLCLNNYVAPSILYRIAVPILCNNVVNVT